MSASYNISFLDWEAELNYRLYFRSKAPLGTIESIVKHRWQTMNKFREL